MGDKMAKKTTKKTTKSVTKKVSKTTKKASSKKKLDIRIVNIVCSSSLGQDIPLIRLAETLPNTEYNPEQFPGLIMRIKEPKT